MYSQPFYDVRNLHIDDTSDERVFIYDVLLPHIRGSKAKFKVSLQNMSQKNRQISLLGGKIITITPLKSKFPPVEFALAWWAKIITAQPSYLYFFGPFTGKEEAKSHCNGYLEDLESEGASIANVEIEYCQPTNITIDLNQGKI